jgi:hypothetical protein
MKYTINGKDYTEFDINKRCAEFMGFEFRIQNSKVLPENPAQVIARLSDVYEPCKEIQDTWPIIEKCWGKLLSNSFESLSPYTVTKWGCLMERHNCTKLVAACICFIEINEVQHDSTI